MRPNRQPRYFTDEMRREIARKEQARAVIPASRPRPLDKG
jgi:hypothetical protein